MKTSDLMFALVRKMRRMGITAVWGNNCIVATRDRVDIYKCGELYRTVWSRKEKARLRHQRMTTGKHGARRPR